MRKLFLNFSVYTVCFFVGVSFFLFSYFANKKENTVDIPKKTESKAQTIATPKEIINAPKIFKVKNFWDEFKDQENKYLIEPGEIDQEDNKIKSAKNWLGLFVDADNSDLRKTKVRINQTNKNQLDFSEIIVEGKDSPLFLVKDLKKVKSGEVETLFYKNPRFASENVDEAALKANFSKEFNLGKSTHRIWTEEGVSEDGERILVLLLSDGNSTQLVDYIDYTGWEPVGNLQWVGDLDSDGKLDFYMDFWNYEKGSYSTGLFISSEAKKGQLVKRFDFFAYGGC